jgi:hypothetical protein
VSLMVWLCFIALVVHSFLFSFSKYSLTPNGQEF